MAVELSLSLLRLWQAVCRGNGNRGGGVLRTLCRLLHFHEWRSLGCASGLDLPAHQRRALTAQSGMGRSAGAPPLLCSKAPAPRGAGWTLPPFSCAVENQRLLITHPAVNGQLPALLTSEVPEVQEECLALLALYAQAEHGRSLLVRHLNLTRCRPDLGPREGGREACPWPPPQHLRGSVWAGRSCLQPPWPGKQPGSPVGRGTCRLE